MSNIVPQQSGVPAAATDDFWGSMDQSDFAIPVVKIGQPTTRKGEPGYFNYNNGASRKVIEGCKLIVPNKNRVLFNGMGGKVRCASDNYYVPSARIQSPICSNCMTCYAASWGDDDPRKIALSKEVNATPGRPPLCKDTYSLLLVDAAWAPFFISFQSTALKEVQEKLFSRLRFEYPGIPPYAVQFDMGLERIANDKGTYYAVRFSNFQKLDEVAAARAAQLYAAHSKTAQKVLAETHAKMEAEAESQSQPQDQWPPIQSYTDQPAFDSSEELPF